MLQNRPQFNVQVAPQGLSRLQVSKQHTIFTAIRGITTDTSPFRKTSVEQYRTYCMTNTSPALLMSLHITHKQHTENVLKAIRILMCHVLTTFYHFEKQPNVKM